MDAVLREFLNGRHIAVLGTVNKDGSVHLANVWYLIDGAHVLVQTPEWSVKARNVTRTGKASIVIDSRGAGQWRGASTSGDAELITEPTDVAPLRARIMAHYMSPDGMNDPRVCGRMLVGDNSIIRITPTRWKWWNVSEMFGGHIDTPGYILPLDD
jgi:PPOX class probable F420-dependent enzyme